MPDLLLSVEFLSKFIVINNYFMGRKLFPIFKYCIIINNTHFLLQFYIQPKLMIGIILIIIIIIIIMIDKTV